MKIIEIEQKIVTLSFGTCVKCVILFG